MISAFLRSLGFHCRHRKISRVFFDKPTGQNYIICMDCCRRYVYDWGGTMQIKEPLAEPVTRCPVEEARRTG
jgi:ribosomal protein S27E